MNSGVSPEVAAQACAKRTAAACLGQLADFFTLLAKELPPDCGVKPVTEVLAHLREKDGSRLSYFVTRLKQELQSAQELSNGEAEQWKSRGDKAGRMARVDDGILMYTRGMMYASLDETLAQLIYARGKLFLAQERFVEALADAHIAFTLLPNNWDALHFRGVCLQKLGLVDEGASDIQAAGSMDAGTANMSDVVTKVINTKRDRVELKKTVSSEGNSLHFKDRLTYKTGTKGVVAKTPLERGEVISERPIAYALYDDHWCIRCCNCLLVTRALYPGREYRAHGKQARGLFCSEVCATQCWERYGQYETNNPFFHLCPVDTLIASRMLRSENATSGFYSLCGNFTGELYPAAVVGGYETAISLSALLIDAVSTEHVDNLRLAQRYVILSGLELSFFTGSQIALNQETQEALIDEPRPILVGKAVYAFAAHLSHSCNPNCYASFVGNPLACSLNLTIRTIRPVSAGEEINIAYSNITTYKAISPLTRRRALAERYGFICNCTACVNAKDERVDMEKKDYFVQAADLYQKGCRLIRETQYDVAITVLLQSYKITMEHLCPPPRPPLPSVPKTHMALARAFNRLKNNQKSVEHILAKIELEQIIYGDDHVGLIDDYIRLAFFADTENERRVFAEKAEELLLRFYAPSKAVDAQIHCLKSFVAKGRFQPQHVHQNEKNW